MTENNNLNPGDFFKIIFNNISLNEIDKVYCKELEKLTNLIEQNQISSKIVREKLERDFRNNTIGIDVFLFMLKYITLVEQTLIFKKYDIQYVSMEILVDLGFFKTIDELNEAIESNPEMLNSCTTKIPCTFPEPTEFEIQQYVDSDDLSKVCIICTSKRRHTICSPCGHNSLCTLCSKTLVENRPEDGVKCPLCRETVHKILRIYQ